MPECGRQAADRAARNAFGRLVAYLAARTRDVAGAEDALADALVSALERWPRTGVPDRPEAWLLTTARRTLIDRSRHRAVTDAASERLRMAAEEAREAERHASFPDERLKLMFVCAHPAVQPSARAPLMLQAVLGIDAARIASAFLVSPAAMRQTLVRAKAKVRETGIGFRVPDLVEMPRRLPEVLDAIYAAYSLGWDDPGDGGAAGLADEAIWLGRVVAALLPHEPEAQGLLALMLFSTARRGARRSPAGAFVPLGDQDTTLWSHAQIDEAEAALRCAARQSRTGRFQLEAAIQAVHVARRSTGKTDWQAIGILYAGLLEIAPAFGAQVGYAAALSEAGQPGEALRLLDAAEPDRAASYQPYWAVRAAVLKHLNRWPEAGVCYKRASGLTQDVQVKAFLLAQARSAP